MKIAESICDDATTKLLTYLHRLGLSACPAAREPLVKRLGNPLFGAEAHGYIDLRESPIEWIDVAVWVGHASTPDEPPQYLYTRYAVPDDRLPVRHPPYTMYLSRRRTFPLFGEVSSLFWRGNRAARDLVSLLNEIPKRDPSSSPIYRDWTGWRSVPILYGSMR